MTADMRVGEGKGLGVVTEEANGLEVVTEEASGLDVDTGDVTGLEEGGLLSLSEQLISIISSLLNFVFFPFPR